MLKGLECICSIMAHVQTPLKRNVNISEGSRLVSSLLRLPVDIVESVFEIVLRTNARISWQMSNPTRSDDQSTHRPHLSNAFSILITPSFSDNECSSRRAQDRGWWLRSLRPISPRWRGSLHHEAGRPKDATKLLSRIIPILNRLNPNLRTAPDLTPNSSLEPGKTICQTSAGGL